MLPYVQFETPDGNTVDLHSGDIIGRSHSAALSIPSPRMSEAHAMVSLRGGQLRLLGLRGRLGLQGVPVHDVGLVPNLEVSLTREYVLRVVQVHVPSDVLAVSYLDRVDLLQASVHSLVEHPEMTLVARFDPDAPLVFFGDGDGWTVWRPDGASEPLVGEERFHIGDQVVAVDRMPNRHFGSDPTDLESQLRQPLSIVTRFTTVDILCEGQPPLQLTGRQAQIVTELGLCDGPVSWHALAQEVWGDAPRDVLRKRLDANLCQLRRKLREARVRANLVRSDGAGHIELFLLPWDDLVERA